MLKTGGNLDKGNNCKDVGGMRAPQSHMENSQGPDWQDILTMLRTARRGGNWYQEGCGWTGDLTLHFLPVPARASH